MTKQEAAPRLAPSPILRLLAAGGGARLVVLPVTGVANLLIARLITQLVGVERFGAVMLISTLSQMLVFADLGASTAVATATTRLDNTHDTQEHFRRTLLTAVRTMLVCSLFLAAVAIGVALFANWSTLLGISDVESTTAPSANVATAVALLAFSISLPFALGEPLQRGTGHLHRAVLLTGVAAPVALVLTLILRAANGPVYAYAMVIPAGALVGMLSCAGGAVRVLKPRLTGLGHQLLHPRRFPGVSIVATAAPTFVIMVGLPLALQSDRIIISHRVDATSLSEYSYAVQLYLPIWSVVSVAALGLWPVFADTKALALGSRRAWLTAVGLLTSLGAAFALGFLLLASLVISWMSADSVSPHLSLLLAFAALLVVQAAHVGTGVMLISPRQLRFQAACVVALVLTNLPLSWVLTPVLGPTGPVLASVVTVAVCQLVPGLLVARRVTRGPGPRPIAADEADATAQV